MQALYHLPDLAFIISRYIQEVLQGQDVSEWSIEGNVSMWNKFHVQLHSSFHG